MADGDVKLIPVDPDNPFPLGRHVFHSPANRQFRALAAPTVPEQPARTRPWNTSLILDQSVVPPFAPASNLPNGWPTGTCTTYAAVGTCRTQPNNARFYRTAYKSYDTPIERIELYLEGQQVDPWPGSETQEPRYEGSSTDAPFRVLRDRGHIAGWKWLFGVDELEAWVTHFSPAAVGTTWLERMFWPRADGTLDVSGQVAGGHAYRITYYDQKRKRFQVTNSWSEQWGVRGRAYIAREDMARLLADQGEAVTVEQYA